MRFVKTTLVKTTLVIITLKHATCKNIAFKTTFNSNTQFYTNTYTTLRARFDIKHSSEAKQHHQQKQIFNKGKDERSPNPFSIKMGPIL